MVKKIISILVILICLINIGFAQNIIFEKKVNQSEVYSNSKILVNLYIKNNENKSFNVELVDYSIPYLSGVVNSKTIQNDNSKEIRFVPTAKNYNEKITLLSYQEINLSYELEFYDMPDSRLNKNEILTKAEMRLNTSEIIYSNEVQIYLKSKTPLVCNYNFICETGETYENCFNDCPKKTEKKNTNTTSNNINNKTQTITKTEVKEEINTNNKTLTEEQIKTNKEEAYYFKLIKIALVIGIVLLLIFIFVKLLWKIKE